MDWKTIKHFSAKEWGPNAHLVAPQLIYVLDAVREKAGVPIMIHCAWSESGHSTKSYHYTGQAVDFHFGGLTPLEQYTLLREQRAIGGVGFYPEWNNVGWHIDLRSGFLQWVQLSNVYIYGHREMAAALLAAGGKR